MAVKARKKDSQHQRGEYYLASGKARGKGRKGCYVEPHQATALSKGDQKQPSKSLSFEERGHLVGKVKKKEQETAALQRAESAARAAYLQDCSSSSEHEVERNKEKKIRKKTNQEKSRNCRRRPSGRQNPRGDPDTLGGTREWGKKHVRDRKRKTDH